MVVGVFCISRMCSILSCITLSLDGIMCWVGLRLRVYETDERLTWEVDFLPLDFREQDVGE